MAYRRFDVVDKSVTGAKLADAVAQEIFTLNMNTWLDDPGIGYCSCDFRDVQNVSHKSLAIFWFSSTEFGAPEAVGTVDVDHGDILKTLTANALFIITTETSGNNEFVGMKLIAADGTYYIMVSYGGRVIATAVTITGN